MLTGYSARLPGFLYALNPGQETSLGAFGIGVLTAVLSTPCTAPFMGAAAAWAIAQAPAAAISIFLAIGTGMGLPYLVLAAVPRLLGMIPKTGPASLLLKQTMGMFMLAAAAYFIGIGLNAWVSESATSSRHYWWPVMAVCAATGAWMGCRAFRLSSSKTGKAICLAAGTFIMASAVIGGVNLTSAGPIAWVPYTPERLALAFKDHKTVVMIFTAEWCLNCKALEQGVWSNPELVESASLPAVMPMKVDLTGSNPEGRAKLREAGSLTIPLVVVYAADGRLVFKSDFYTAGQIKEAIKAAQSG
jgi:thiol:disulfide interchange protein